MPIEFAPPSAQVQPFQIPAAQYTDPLETLARMGQLRTQNLQQQNTQLQLQQSQMQLASQRGMLAAFVQAGNDPDKAVDLMMQSGQVLAPDIMGFQTHLQDYKNKIATWRKDQQEIAAKDFDTASGAYQNVDSVDALNAANAKLRKQGVNEDALITAYPGDPEHMKAMANGLGMYSQILERQSKEAETQAKATDRRTKDLGLAASQADNVTDQASLDSLRSQLGPEAQAFLPKVYTPVVPGIIKRSGISAQEQVTQGLERRTKDLALAANEADDVTDQASLDSLRSKLGPEAQAFLPKTYDSSTPLKIKRLGIPAPEQVTQALTEARDRVDAAYKNGQITLDQYKVYLDRLKNDPFGVLGSLPPPAVPEIMPGGAPQAAPAGGTSVVTPSAAGAPSPAPGEPIVTPAPRTIQDLAPAGQIFVSSPDGKTRRLVKLAEMPPLLEQGWTVSNTPLAQEPGGAVRLAPTTGAPQPTPTPTPGGAPGLPMSIGQAMQKGITGEALEPYIPAALKPQVNAIIRGLVPVPGSAGIPRSPMQEQLMQIVTARDPTFSPLRYEARQNVLTGHDAPDIQALNTIPVHIDAALKAAEALKNFKFQPGNQVWNMFARVFGTTPTTDFNAFKTIVESDLARALGSQTIPEIQALGKNIHDAQSPDQLNKALMDYLDATHKRLNVYEERFHQINPTDPNFSLITPSAREVLDRRIGRRGIKVGETYNANGKKQKVVGFNENGQAQVTPLP